MHHLLRVALATFVSAILTLSLNSTSASAGNAPADASAAAAPAVVARAMDRPTPEALRKKCNTRDDTIYRHKGCRGWGGGNRGTRIGSAFSYYTYTPSSGGDVDNFGFNFKLSDTKADGRCAWTRIKKTGAHDYDFWVGAPVCGKGTSDVRNLTFRGLAYTAPGRMTFFLCSGKVASRCKAMTKEHFHG